MHFMHGYYSNHVKMWLYDINRFALYEHENIYEEFGYKMW